MPNILSHFAITADNVARAKAFYETVFGWTFTAWGPPNFYRITGAGVHGALEERRDGAVAGGQGYGLTFAVQSLEQTSELIRAAGGEILSEPFTIPGVGTLSSFQDTEHNQAMVMEYTAEAISEMGLRPA